MDVRNVTNLFADPNFDNDQAQLVLNTQLSNYFKNKLIAIENTEVYTLGTPKELVKAFIYKPQYLKVIKEFEEELYKTQA